MRNGTGHWFLTRVTTLPLAAAFLYFLTQADYVTTTSRMQFLSWLQQPVTFGALVVFILCGFWHAKLGMEEIIIDYVPAPALQKAALALNALFFLILGGAALYAAWGIKKGVL